MKNIKKLLCVLTTVIIMSTLFVSSYATGTVKVADFIEPNLGVDTADEIQALIDANPNRTIEFPDGEYLVSKPVLTSADPTKSVSLKMTDFTVIKAIGDWPEGEAVIQLGGKDPANTTHESGSNYSLEAGVIDGNGIANGVSINSGRETQIRNTSIKNTVVGLHIMYGANSGSSDADITNVNIIGTGKTDSVGVILEGYDNTLTNMRIGFVCTGVIIKSSGNMLRNIHPLFYSDETYYQNTCGFVVYGGNNWLDYCYSDQFETGFLLKDSAGCTLNDCFAMWYADMGDKTGIDAEGRFNATVTNFTLNMWGESTNTVLKVDEIDGEGTITNLSVSGNEKSDTVYKAYLPSSNIFQQIFRLIMRLTALFKNFKISC